MSTTLKLNISTKLLRKAEAYAMENGRNLSDLVEDYLRNLTNQQVPDHLVSNRISGSQASDALMGNYCG